MKKFIFGLIGVVIVVAGFFLYDREDYTTDDTIRYEYKKAPAKKQEPKRKSYSALKEEEAEALKKVLESDSNFAEEIVAWDELQGLLSEFCIDGAHMEWFGNMECASAMEGMRNLVAEVRVKDLHRILQLEGGSDPATKEMVEYKKKELLKAIERACILVAPIDVAESVLKGEELENYIKLYRNIQKNAELLPKAIDKWIKTRSRYRGCTAIALDDMKDAAILTHPDYPEELNIEDSI